MLQINVLSSVILTKIPGSQWSTDFWVKGSFRSYPLALVRTLIRVILGRDNVFIGMWAVDFMVIFVPAQVQMYNWSQSKPKPHDIETDLSLSELPCVIPLVGPFHLTLQYQTICGKNLGPPSQQVDMSHVTLCKGTTITASYHFHLNKEKMKYSHACTQTNTHQEHWAWLMDCSLTRTQRFFLFWLCTDMNLSFPLKQRQQCDYLQLHQAYGCLWTTGTPIPKKCLYDRRRKLGPQCKFCHDQVSSLL